jgi:tetratricopeptide (TPR) repeat protein
MVDDKDKPLPFAAVYIAETPEDFYKAPRVYSSEISPGNADVSALVFQREKANRLLHFRADDNGEFQTVWRRDIISNALLPLVLFKGSLKQIAFAVGLPGYSQKVVSVERQADGKRFVRGQDPVRLEPNILPPIVLEPGEEVIKPPVSIDASLLQIHHPGPPSGKAAELFALGEKAFTERKFGDALKKYNEALEKAPNDPRILMSRLDTYYWLGQYQEVVEKGEEILELYPEYGFVHKMIADAAFLLSQFELNREHLIKAQQLDPEWPYSYTSLWKLDPRFAVVPAGWLPALKIFHNTR